MEHPDHRMVPCTLQCYCFLTIVQGQPHSGISDGQTNLFINPQYQNQTIEVLTFLTQQLSTVTNVAGIEILNEPQNDPGLEDLCMLISLQVFPLTYYT